MSHISTIELEINSLSDLKSACDKLGIQFRKNQKTYAWYGRWVGDYPMPEGMKESDLGKCNHAIHVPGCAYEIGVIQTSKGKHTLVWDFWKAGGLERKLGKNCGKLKQAYAEIKIRKSARAKGYKVNQCRTDTGIRLVLSA